MRSSSIGHDGARGLCCNRTTGCGTIEQQVAAEKKMCVGSSCHAQYLVTQYIGNGQRVCSATCEVACIVAYWLICECVPTRILGGILLHFAHSLGRRLGLHNGPLMPWTLDACKQHAWVHRVGTCCIRCHLVVAICEVPRLIEDLVYLEQCGKSWRWHQVPGRMAPRTASPSWRCPLKCCSIFAASWRMQMILQAATWLTRGVQASMCTWQNRVRRRCLRH